MNFSYRSSLVAVPVLLSLCSSYSSFRNFFIA